MTATVKLGATTSQTRTSACAAGAWSVAAVPRSDRTPTRCRRPRPTRRATPGRARRSRSRSTPRRRWSRSRAGQRCGGHLPVPHDRERHFDRRRVWDRDRRRGDRERLDHRRRDAERYRAVHGRAPGPTRRVRRSRRRVRTPSTATQVDAAGNSGTSGAKTVKIVPPIVHVTTTGNGGSATGDGSVSSPVDTVNGAITLAQSYGFNQIRISQGTYSEGNTGVALVSNLAISGGWNLAFTAQSGVNTSTVIQGGQQAMLADGDTGVTLSQLMLSGMGASAVDRSVYGLRRSMARTSPSPTFGSPRRRASRGRQAWPAQRGRPARTGRPPRRSGGTGAGSPGRPAEPVAQVAGRWLSGQAGAVRGATGGALRGRSSAASIIVSTAGSNGWNRRQRRQRASVTPGARRRRRDRWCSGTRARLRRSRPGSVAPGLGGTSGGAGTGGGGGGGGGGSGAWRALAAAGVAVAVAVPVAATVARAARRWCGRWLLRRLHVQLELSPSTP